MAACTAGHAVQHRNGPVRIAIYNLAAIGTGFGSGPGLAITAIGLLFGLQSLLLIGVLLFNAAFILQILCLPIRLDACRRAEKYLTAQGLADFSSGEDIRRVMSAWALIGLAMVVQPVAALAQRARSPRS